MTHRAPGTLDHLVIAAATLDEGADWFTARTRLGLSPGGQHPLMGTHNRLLSLGDQAYLEVIAIDPDAPGPDHPRWFDLDRREGPPALRTWVVRVPDLEAALAVAPPGSGVPRDFARADLRWRMAVPQDGRLPFDNLFPALIEWQTDAHPAPRLADAGARLQRLRLAHPRSDALRDALAAILEDPRVAVEAAEHPAMTADLDTPGGMRAL
ncbi:VOC family protein [Rhodobaculum claviforme]|uniref:Polyphosphate kinase n=1 Tax=Rhodobaculum claviforme TaxID=1549854 RepID=A0A934WJM0_9RHOB|nr:VOC family protein [Rhodobaculum claviforme]MBK5928201.1 polyphosphate kinase [Rhodobaculum claviforme]